MEGGDRASQPSKMKMKMEMEEDRLSPLPDEIIHHIFSFLDMGSIARTAFLAKRWRYLYTQTPVLNFNIYPWMMSYYSSLSLVLNSEQYMELIDKFMFSTTLNITKFNLEMMPSPDSSRLISWLLAALNRNINIVNLHLPPLEPMELPHQMFTTSSNIEFFTFSSDQFAWATVRMPRSLCTAPRIKHLSLHRVLFPDGDVNGELVFSCPFLEYLHLERCDVSNLKIFNISTPRLQILEMLSVFTQEGASCKVKICTPNLVRLQIKAGGGWELENFVLDYQIMEDLSSLAEIEIDVLADLENDVCKNMWQSSLVGILLKAPNLQSLHLQSTSLQILTNISGLLQKLPNWFHNLKYVRLDDTCRAPLHTLLKIMRGLPRLETFALSRLSLYEHEPRAEELSFDCIFHHLKSIKISHFGDRSNDFKFLELLLMKAPVLETVAIDTEIMSCKEDSVELVNKLQALPRASSTLAMICKTDSYDFKSLELQLMKEPVSYEDPYAEDSYDLWRWSP